MKCPFCLGANGPGANFCSNCGSPLNLLVCSHCERINERGMTTCRYCESALSDTEMHAAQPPEPSEKRVDGGEKTTEDWRELLQHIEEEINRLDARTMASPANKEEGEACSVSSVEIEPRPAHAPRALAFSPPTDTITIDQLTSTAEPRKSFSKLALLFVVSAAFAVYLFISLPPLSTPAVVNNVIKQDDGSSNTRPVFSQVREVSRAEASAAGASAAISPTASLLRDGNPPGSPEPILTRVQAGLTSFNDAPPKPSMKTTKKPAPRRASAARQDERNVLRGRLY